MNDMNDPIPDPAAEPVTAPVPTPAPPAPPSPPAGGPAAGSATRRWCQAPAVAQPLTAIRLGQDAALVVPFTTDDHEVSVHYADYYPDLTGHVRCAGGGCLLCQLEKRQDTRFLLPVYYPRDHRVAVLPVPPGKGVGALGPALAPYLARVEQGERMTLSVVRNVNNTYAVTALPVPPVTSGLAVMAQFLVDHAAGRVKLESAFPAPTRAELFRIPAIEREARSRGIEE